MNLLDTAPIEELPLTAAKWHQDTDGLPCDVARALWRLLVHVAKHGLALPLDEADRARIAGISIRRFISAAPCLVPFFDVDEAGRWTKHNLVEWRQEKLDAKVKQRADGRAGGLAKAENRRRREEEQRQAERQTRAEAQAREAGELPDGFAESLGSGKGEPRVGLGYLSQTLAEAYADPSCYPLGSGVASGGLTDRLGSHPEEDKAPVGLSVSEPSVGSDGACDRSQPSRVSQPNPSPVLAEQDVAEPPTAEMSNDDIAQLIITEGGDGLVPNWPRGKTFKVLRAAMGGGADLRLDYLPSLRDFIEGARKGSRGRCEVPANPEIMAATYQRRDRRRMTPAAAAMPPIAVDVELPENVEPLALYRAAAGKTYLNTKYRNGYKVADVDPSLWEQCRQQVAARPGSGMSAP